MRKFQISNFKFQILPIIPFLLERTIERRSSLESVAKQACQVGRGEVFHWKFEIGNYLKLEVPAKQEGQSLITLLFIMVIAITIISAAAVIVMANTATATTVEQSKEAYYGAEGAIENGLLRSLRDSSYTGETLTIGDAIVTFQIANGYATASATVGKIIKKIQIQTVYNNGALLISSWKEL